MSVSLLALLKIFTGLATYWLKQGNEYMGVIVQPFSLQHMLEIFHKKVKRKPEYQSRGEKVRPQSCFFFKSLPLYFWKSQNSLLGIYYLRPFTTQSQPTSHQHHLSAPSLNCTLHLNHTEPFWTTTFTFIFPVKLLLTGMSFLLYSPTQIAITMAKTGN